MLKQILLLLLIIIIIIMMYTLGKDNGIQSNVVEGLDQNDDQQNNTDEEKQHYYKYYIENTENEEKLYDNLDYILFNFDGDHFTDQKDRKNKKSIEIINKAPDAYHFQFDHKEDRIKLFPLKDKATLHMDAGTKQIDLIDNDDKSKSYFKYNGNTICQIMKSDKSEYTYMLAINDRRMTNLLPIYFITFVLLKRMESDRA